MLICHIAKFEVIFHHINEATLIMTINRILLDETLIYIVINTLA